MQKSRLLGNKKTGKHPQNIIFLDTETEEVPISPNKVKLKLQLGWAAYVSEKNDRPGYHEKWFWFNKTDQINKYIESKLHKKRPLYIFASNPDFDLKVIDFYRYFTEAKWELDFFTSNQMVYILKISKNKQSIIVMAVQNYLKLSVKHLGEAIDLPKLDIDFKDATPYQKTIYCKRDVEIIKKTIMDYLQYIRPKDFGAFAYTAPGQAFNHFTNKFSHKKIWTNHTPEIADLARAAYFGGRNECFQIGKIPTKNVYVLDINSMYPYVMKENDYPVELRGYYVNPPLPQIKKLLKKFAISAEVIINLKNPYIAKIVNQKTCFPIGIFTAFVNTAGLQKLFEDKAVLHIKRIAVYKKMNIFKDYVNYWYRLKKRYTKRCDDQYTLITKLFLNSLYGKFGQKRPKILDRRYVPENTFKKETIISMTSGHRMTQTTLFHKQTTEMGYLESYKSVPAIAAHVTENARLLLWELIAKAGSDNVYYCDTDSLFVNELGYHFLESEIDKDKLGKLKLEGVYNKAVLHTCKDYELDNLIKIKGVKKGSKKIQDTTYWQERFQSIKADLREGIYTLPIIERYKKTLKRTYDKGILAKDGKVYPFHLLDEGE